MNARRTLLATLLALAMPGAHAWSNRIAAPEGSGCDPLTSEPVNEQVRFESDIQPHIGGVPGFMIPPRCDPCHTILDRGDMRLDPENVLDALLGPTGNGTPSPHYPGFRRVVPGRPEQSLVFLRINCHDAVGPDSRMPPNIDGSIFDPEYLRMQALVHDWIKSGAVMEGGDRIFVNGAESLR